MGHRQPQLPSSTTLPGFHEGSELGGALSMHRCQPRIRGADLLIVNFEPNEGTAELKGSYAGSPTPAKRIADNDVAAESPVCLQATSRQLHRIATEMRRAVHFLVGKLPYCANRRLRPEIMLFITSKQVDGLVLSVGPSAAPLRHGIALTPDDLTTEKPVLVAQS